MLIDGLTTSLTTTRLSIAYLLTFSAVRSATILEAASAIIPLSK